MPWHGLLCCCLPMTLLPYAPTYPCVQLTGESAAQVDLKLAVASLTAQESPSHLQFLVHRATDMLLFEQ